MRAEPIENLRQQIQTLEAEQRTIGQKVDDLAVSIANKKLANDAAPHIARWLKSPNAYELYAVGSLENYYIIIEIKIPKTELEKHRKI